MNKSEKTINQMFLLMVTIYTALLLIISTIACYYAYTQRKSQLLSSMDISLSYIQKEYEDILDNFWQVYMPVYEDTSSYAVFKNYFASEDDLTPIERRQLLTSLSQMSIRDSSIQWIGIYSENRDTNYILFTSNNSLQAFTTDFPYLEQLQAKTLQMEIYEATDPSTVTQTHMMVVAGGAPSGMGSGSIIIWYSLNAFESSITSDALSLSSAHFFLTDGDQLLFDSSGNYEKETVYFASEEGKHSVVFQGQRLYVRSVCAGTNTSLLSYSVSYWELFFYAHQNTPFILLITLIFTLLAISIHSLMNNAVTKEISIIQQGLNKIADNDFEYKITTDLRQDGFPEIAQNINDMSDKLNENIRKAYYFELKQKDAQLAELQAAFNPHFLFNTLEMLKNKSYANGDTETSDLISQLAAIFRGLINTKVFIPLWEELSFSNRYLTLLNARYGDCVESRFDIPSELLDYGIIRNVFQILIENYFVHGFSPEADKNHCILFSGESIDESHMIFCVADNGTGLSAEDMQKLNNRIQEPIRHGEKHYGLKNLNQRLKLFYGPDCGVKVLPGIDGGFAVQLTMRKMTVTDYEKSLEMKN